MGHAVYCEATMRRSMGIYDRPTNTFWSLVAVYKPHDTDIELERRKGTARRGSLTPDDLTDPHQAPGF
jgi:hypothetical protein